MPVHPSSKLPESPNKTRFLNGLVWFFIFVLPIVLFFVLLNLNWPIPFLKIVTDNSIFAFTAIFGLFVLCFHLTGKKALLVGLVLTVVVFVFPLVYKWLTGHSDTNILGSFIPYKDGFYFYGGARKLLLGRVIAIGSNDFHRPLLPAMEAWILFLTRNNLQLTLSLFDLGMSFGCYLAAYQVKKMFGPWPAALLMTLLVAFARNFIGYNLSEIPGLTMACLALFLLLRGAKNQKLFDLCLGIVVLVFALSLRAGAFFILPAIAVWGLFAFRKKKILAWKIGIAIFLVMSIAFVTANIVIPKLIVAPGAPPLSQFAGVLYGQARGGAGMNQVGLDLPGADTSLIMSETLSFIQHHPLGIIVGTLKSYFYYFIPSNDGIFNLLSGGSQWTELLFWLMNTLLLIMGIVYCIRNIKKPVFSFLLASFGGLLLSIPFVPPMDLGNRIYAASIPLFFILPALGLLAIWNDKRSYPLEPALQESSPRILVIILSVLLLLLLTVTPMLIPFLQKPPDYSVVSCSKSQTPFAVQLYRGSFVDILKSSSPDCGRAPNLCLTDFNANGTDKASDDFFRMLVKKAQDSTDGIRLTASVDLISSKYLFFVGTSETLPATNPDGLVVGCATQENSQFQYILWVDSRLKQ